jgi:polyhydroxyalkanoate synthesis regulator phasin
LGAERVSAVEDHVDRLRKECDDLGQLCEQERHRHAQELREQMDRRQVADKEWEERLRRT